MNPFAIRVLAILFLTLGIAFLIWSRDTKDITKDVFKDQSREVLVEARVPSHVMQQVMSGEGVSLIALMRLDEQQAVAVLTAESILNRAPSQANRVHRWFVGIGILFSIVGGIGFLITKKERDHKSARDDAELNSS